MIPIANPELGDTEKESVLNVIDSGMLADGPEVRDFEEEFAEFCGVNYGVATSNGTTALHAVLEALGIGEGDTVLTTPFSFIATANVIRLAGAEPVFADINPKTYNLDPTSVSQVAEEVGGIDAIIAVHLYGLPSAINELQSIANRHDAYLIEDAAQAHGAEYEGERVGSFGDAACFSFYPTKNMTTGEGGIVVTENEEVANATAQFINHGRDGGSSYTHAKVGHNFRMTSIAAAMGREQLNRLPEFIAARQRNAAALSEGLEGAAVETPSVPEDRTHVFHQYTVRTTDREGLQEHLDEHDVGYGVYYPTCIHQQPAYADIEQSAPVAEQAAKEVLSLPVHPNLSESDIQTIVEVVSNYDY